MLSHLRVVELPKTEEGLGFNVMGGKEQNSPIYISRIIPGAAMMTRTMLRTMMIVLGSIRWEERNKILPYIPGMIGISPRKITTKKMIMIYLHPYYDVHVNEYIRCI